LNRKKRLKKGIVSIEKQLVLHKEKKDEAKRNKKFELVGYYKREIEAKKEDKEYKERLLKKK